MVQVVKSIEKKGKKRMVTELTIMTLLLFLLSKYRSLFFKVLLQSVFNSVSDIITNLSILTQWFTFKVKYFTFSKNML